MNKKEKKGAGFPAFFSKPMKRINVMLDEDTVKFYTEQGGGNLSKGIREYWRGLTKRAVDGAIWRCDYCDCSNQGSRQVCWHCETPRN